MLKPNLLKHKFGIILLLLIGNVVVLKAEFMHLKFFSEDISVPYNDLLFSTLEGNITKEGIEVFYNNLELKDYQATFEQLLKYREDLQLNDWFFYLLIQECSKAIFKDQSPNHSTLFSWLMLSQAGYKAHLNFYTQKVVLSVYTLQKVFDIPTKKHGMARMAYLNSKTLFEHSDVPTFYLTDKKKPFSFSIKQYPVLKNSQKARKVLQFIHDAQTYRVNFTLDQTLIEMLATYPETSVQSHVNTAFSTSTHHSLIPALKNLIKDKSTPDALRLLLSFTRTAFQYENDKIYQCDNLTFFPEETLFYPYSDCEDRSILFTYLAKELLDIKGILLNYDDHVAVGLKLDPIVGKRITYKNEAYVFCEPTDPQNLLDIGEYPASLMGKTYSVFER